MTAAEDRRQTLITPAKRARWDEFSAAHHIAARGVPLFATTAGRAVAAPYGRDGRLVLPRSAAMEALVVAEVGRIVDDHATGGTTCDGLLYMMHWRDGEAIVPLYIGKAEKHGRAGGNLSANLAGIPRDRAKFARWGSNYAYHLGDLSAAACPGQTVDAPAKYRRWADRLFVDAPSPAPLLRRETWFWATAWGGASASIWPEYGPTSLTFQEYLLIGVASDLFPDVLLNSEGVNRR